MAILTETILVSDPQLGNFSIAIPDIKKPDWFGDYQTGKLSIYVANLFGTPLLPCFGLIYIVSAQDDGALDAVGYCMYHASVKPLDAIDHLMVQLNHQYCLQAIRVRDASHASIH